MAILPTQATQEISHIGLAAFGVYAIYCEFRDADPASDDFGLAWPSRREIAKLTGLNSSYVSTMRTKLADEGWIEIIGYTNKGNAIVKLLKGADEFALVADKRRANKTSQAATKARPQTSPTTARPRRQAPTNERGQKAAHSSGANPRLVKEVNPSDNLLDNPTSFDYPTLSDARILTPRQAYSFSFSGRVSNTVGLSNGVGNFAVYPLDNPTTYKEDPLDLPIGKTNLPPKPLPAHAVGRSVGSLTTDNQQLATANSRHSRELWLEYATEQFRLGLGIKYPTRFAECRWHDGKDDWKLDVWLKAKADWGDDWWRSRNPDLYVGAHMPVANAPDELLPPVAPMEHSAFWRDVLPRIADRISWQSFETWFVPLNAIERDGCAVITAPDRVFADWLENNYADVLHDVGLAQREWEFA